MSWTDLGIGLLVTFMLAIFLAALIVVVDLGVRVYRAMRDKEEPPA